MIGVNVEMLVSSMDGLSSAISKEWLALILLPAVSALAECIGAINVSVKDQLTLAMSVAIGSTIVRVSPASSSNALTDESAIVCSKRRSLSSREHFWFLCIDLISLLNRHRSTVVLLGMVTNKPLALLFDPFESLVSIVLLLRGAKSSPFVILGAVFGRLVLSSVGSLCHVCLRYRCKQSLR